jgi:hypothetical protein
MASSPDLDDDVMLAPAESLPKSSEKVGSGASEVHLSPEDDFDWEAYM